ncbi:MAG TPA: TVP38/TMEM64 family protein [Verrucomicrobiae bacterium]|jgi:uncharacterized membrane protein YdjX (TVP38/TMEM64 family)|nr:TVP38/TMEM64 family protein [Verrucomicrobiae bacterium]
MRSKKHRLLIRGAILAALVALIFVLSKYTPQPLNVFGPGWEELEDLHAVQAQKERIMAFLASFGSYSAAVFVILQALQVVVAPIPGELTGVVGGFVFGKVYGLILSMVGLMLGSWVAFELASILGRPFVERLIKKDIVDKFDFLTRSNAGVMVAFLLFLIPGFPKDMLCFLLGLSRMRLRTFLVVSTIGRLPGTYLLTVQGASVREEEYGTTVVLIVVSAAVVVAAYLYRTRLFHWIQSLHHHAERNAK